MLLSDEKNRILQFDVQKSKILRIIYENQGHSELFFVRQNQEAYQAFIHTQVPLLESECDDFFETYFQY